eukprot:4280112-Lingulodinium_polyedra.AAC.1
MHWDPGLSTNNGESVLGGTGTKSFNADLRRNAGPAPTQLPTPNSAPWPDDVCLTTSHASRVLCNEAPYSSR